MDARVESERIPRIPLCGLLAVVVCYLGASVYLAGFEFPHEPLLDYGIGKTAYSSLWAGPIGGLRDLRGPGAFFGVVAYILGSGVFLWLSKNLFFAERRIVRFLSGVGAVAWWFLSGAAIFGSGYVVF